MSAFRAAGVEGELLPALLFARCLNTAGLRFVFFEEGIVGERRGDCRQYFN